MACCSELGLLGVGNLLLSGVEDLKEFLVSFNARG